MKVDYEPPSRAKEILKGTPSSNDKFINRYSRESYNLLCRGICRQGKLLDRSTTLLDFYVTMGV